MQQEQPQMKSFQASELQQCALCDGPALQPIVNHALFQKYSSSQDFFYTKQLNEILQQPEKGTYTPAVALYKQYTYYDEINQEMRRMYEQHEYQGKIEMISEYYKFHRDVPMCYNKPIEKVMGKYYSRLREFDYKNIKKVLKDQQGISLTTQKSDSSIDSENSSFVKKSRYSTMLGGLKSEQSRTESRLLLDICDRIEKKIPLKVNSKRVFNLKGSFETGEKEFESFLAREKMKKKKRIEPNTFNKNKANKFVQEFGSREEIQNTFKKRITRQNFFKNSIEGTTANETASRQQKNKRFQKAKLRGPYISSKKLVFTQKPQSQTNKLFKPLISNMMAFRSNSKVKTVDEIYKKSVPMSTAEKLKNEKARKSSISSTINSSNKKVSNKRIGFKESIKKLPSYASKELQPQFRTIQVDKLQRFPSRDRFSSHGPRTLRQTQENAEVKPQLAKNSSRRSVSLSAQKQKNTKTQLEKNSFKKRKSFTNLDSNKIRTYSSKQIEKPSQSRYNQQLNRDPVSKGIVKYQSTDLKKSSTIEKVIENKLKTLKKGKILF